MIKHMVMLKFKPEVSQEQRAEFGKMSVGELGQIPGVKNLIMGGAFAVVGKPLYNVALLMDFDDEAQLKAYLEHPTHKAAAAQLPAMCSDVLILDCLY